MSDQDDIPVLNDLIERGIEITLSDLGLNDESTMPVSDTINTELSFTADEAAPYRVDAALTPALGTDPLAVNPALEQAIRRILDEHMELAWQEIRLAIQQHLDRS